MRTVEQLHRKWITEQAGCQNERFGQWFMNRYVKSDDSILNHQLFYADTSRAYQLIMQWCIDNCYEYTMPTAYRDLTH